MLLSIAVVTGVAECVVAALENTPGGVPNRVCPVVPGAIAWDNCECGQLAQTITSVAPTRAFPTPSSELPDEKCGSPMVVVSVTLSLTRCVTGVDDRGNSPRCASLFEEAVILEADRAAVRRAVRCCLANIYAEMPPRIFAYTVGAVNSVGPEGGCAGIEMTYQFGIANDCCE